MFCARLPSTPLINSEQSHFSLGRLLCWRIPPTTVPCEPSPSVSCL